MKDFKKGGFRRERGGGGFDRRPSFGRPEGRSFDRPQLFPAVCDKCGKSCEVPFKPNGSRPVYCSDCFGLNRGGAPEGRSPRRDFSAPTPQAFAPKVEDRRIDDIKRQLDSLMSKLDKLIEVVGAANRASSTPKVAAPEIVWPATKSAPKDAKSVVKVVKKAKVAKKEVSKKKK